jgi:hypothetical protein
MRQRVTDDRLRAFMRALAHAATAEGRVYIVGGASAVLLGWRDSTLDVDIKIIPEHGGLLRAIPALKESLQVNVELASPDDFIPALPGWEDRSPFITREGKLSFHHYDFYAQALAKIERGHDIDRGDVQEMLAADLVKPAKLRELFAAIEPDLYRYPAVDAASFRRALDAVAPLE